MFISSDEIPTNELNDLISNAIQSAFPPQNPIPITKLSDDLSVAELFHGPTMSFKVIQVYCNLMPLDHLVPGFGFIRRWSLLRIFPHKEAKKGDSVGRHIW